MRTCGQGGGGLTLSDIIGVHMAKDYFQDITPPEGGPPAPRPAPLSSSDSDDVAEIPIRTAEAPAAPPRGIRNISAPRARPPARVGRMDDLRESPSIFGGEPPPHPPRRSRWWLWGLAAICILALGGLSLFAFRATTVSVIPKSHTVVFDETSTFTAYPAASAATGTLSYTVQISDLEDSEVVPSQGTTHAETKASGSIIVYNNYSASSVKLIKNTRFETPDGLVFRVPAEVLIPGKKGTAPGSVSITVVADKAGDKYNVGPIAKFTLPGLKSSPDMYATVYAKSTTAFTGGFIGDRPAVAPGALEKALSSVRARLESKARAAGGARGDSAVVFPELMRITYQELPNTTEAGGGVRIHEKAHVVMPVFPAAAFAQTVAKAVSADAEGAPIKIVAGKDFGAHTANTSSALGAGPVNFTLTGQAELVWEVDVEALAQALAGRDSQAFQTIVNGFSGIQEAHARIEPFWKTSFPGNAADIKVDVQATQ